ncbi:MAG: DEAD/DEAH box helicase [archaeon]
MQEIKTVQEFEKSKSLVKTERDTGAQEHRGTEEKLKPTAHSPSQNDQMDSVSRFRKLGISETILKAIAEQGFTVPTEIQIKAIPLVVAGKDVIARAATGSGKTLAFGSGIIQNTNKGKGPQALILTPTRELAEQNAGELKKFSKYKPLRIVTIYGGVAINPQIHAVRTADIVVGTPGRLLDHMERRTISLNNINTLVLDEADRMLDMGFLPDVKRILGACPRERQTLLFSATVSSGISHLAQKYMKDPREVFAESYVDPAKLEQIYYDVPNNLKFSLLVHLLKNESSKLVMIFCNTRHMVDVVAENLEKQGIHAIPIHGGFAQAKRNKTLGRFHSQESQVLVCTDVAARGLDIPHVSHIYNYDIPKESTQYIHRIGRTARAGKEGKVINILSESDHLNFRKVMNENAGKIKRTERPYIKTIQVTRSERKRYRPGGGGRGRSSGRRPHRPPRRK